VFLVRQDEGSVSRIYSSPVAAFPFF